MWEEISTMKSHRARSTSGHDVRGYKGSVRSPKTLYSKTKLTLSAPKISAIIPQLDESYDVAGLQTVMGV